MDFGDILDAWDKQTARAVKKRGVIPGDGGEEQRSVDPMTAWLRVNGVYDKDAESPAAERQVAERRRRLRTKKPDAILDLHGLTRDEAWAVMETFFEESRMRELEKVLLIHGKGNHSEGEAVLRRAVLQFIEKCPYAGESGQPAVELGGSGATWVLLKATVHGK
ncbi:MAG: Smr/MutS family protein [Treponema sp.]|jgi:DNA-nicking Smr family endonuclease|nr:Smr/MutS family protein [Treponema sp.]